MDPSQSISAHINTERLPHELQRCVL